MSRIPIVALASGSGTLFQSLIDAAAQHDYPGEVIALVTDRPGCGAHQRAERQGLPVVAVSPHDFADRASWDAALTRATAELGPQWLVCVGFMRILGRGFLARFPGRVINSHPSLLPSFPGAHAVADALDYGVRITGCTVHLVDEGVDTGPILAQVPVPVEPGDTADALHERVKVAERELIVDVVARAVTTGYNLNGRKATWL